MISISKNTQIPSVSSVLGILDGYNRLMPICIDFDKVCQYIFWYSTELDRIGGPLFEELKGVRGRDKLNDLLLIWLKRHGEDLSVFDRTYDGISFSKESFDKAYESGRLSPEATSIMKQYQEFSTDHKTRRTLMGYLQFPIMDFYSPDNHRIIGVYPEWRKQNTNRVAMFNPAFQNLNREMQDIFTVPKGWTRVYCDSGQIEPRTIYSAYLPDPQIKALINLYGDAYFGVLHYCLMPLEHIADKRLVFEKMDTDKLKDSRQVIKTYGNAVMYGSKSNPTKDPIKQAMIDRIGNHPMRLAWIEELSRAIDMGEQNFKTYFGTPINIYNSPKLDGFDFNDKEGLKYQLLKLAINNPIQGTAADLMRVSITEAYKLLNRKAPNSVISMYIHDAGVFAVSEDDYDKVIDDLKDIVAYNVEGWIPIHADAKIGRNEGLFKDLY